MYPVIFYLGDYPVRSWGIMVAAGILAGLWLASTLAKRQDIEPETLGTAVLALFIIMYKWRKERAAVSNGA